MFQFNPNDQTYRLTLPSSAFEPVFLISFDADEHASLSDRALICTDDLDGSSFDEHRDDKWVEMSLHDDEIVLQTLPEDFSYWKDTEQALAQGCLGYLAQTFQEYLGRGCVHLTAKHCPDDLDPQQPQEVFAWNRSLVAPEHLHLLPPVKKPFRHV